MKGKGPHPLLSGHLNQGFLAGRHLLNPSAALKVHLCQQFHLRTKGGFICVGHNEESPYEVVSARKPRISAQEDWRRRVHLLLPPRLLWRERADAHAAQQQRILGWLVAIARSAWTKRVNRTVRAASFKGDSRNPAVGQ
jgi:hypothetical protein